MNKYKMLRIFVTAILCVLCITAGYAQAQNKKLKIQLTEYFKNYINPNYTSKDKITVKDVVSDPSIPVSRHGRFRLPYVSLR